MEHQPSCPPGWVGDWLSQDGADLDVRRPYAGDLLPEDLGGHAALVVMGGSMGPYDDAEHPWLPGVRDLLRLAARDELLALGICLGHQLGAVALGGTVVRNPRGPQIGVFDVGWTPEASVDPLVGSLAAGPVRAVQWNYDIVTTTPTGSVVLARTADGDVQAARFAPTVWGVQWHPEAGEAIIRDWVEEDRDEAAEHGVDLDRYAEEVAEADPELQATWRRLAERFLSLTRERQEVR